MGKRHVFLTGFMGAGKSRVGRYLAQRLNFPFLDTDKKIEEKTSKSVKTIFETDGESIFRRIEKEIVETICRDPLPHVVSLGGGALNDRPTFRLVRQSGVVVYLKSAPQSILQRVRHTDKRPLLNVKSKKDRDAALLERITELLAQREPIYSQADIVVDRDNLEAEEVAELVLRKINQFWNQHYATD